MDAMKGSTQEAKARLVGQLAADLAPKPIRIDPAEMTPEMIALLKMFRKSLLINALRGQVDEVADLRKVIVNDDLPDAIQTDLLAFQAACEKVACEMAGSRVAVSVDMATAEAEAGELESDRGYQRVVAFRELPSGERERMMTMYAQLGGVSRGEGKGGTSALDLVIAQENNRPKLMEAAVKLHEAYQKGAITRLECLKKMQELRAGNLELRQKRSQVYQAAKELRAKAQRENREQRNAVHQARKAQVESRTIHSVSPNWPNLSDCPTVPSRRAVPRDRWTRLDRNRPTCRLTKRLPSLLRPLDWSNYWGNRLCVERG